MIFPAPAVVFMLCRLFCFQLASILIAVVSAVKVCDMLGGLTQHLGTAESKGITYAGSRWTTNSCRHQVKPG
jgi:hypothetical protein